MSEHERALREAHASMYKAFQPQLFVTVRTYRPASLEGFTRKIDVFLKDLEGMTGVHIVATGNVIQESDGAHAHLVLSAYEKSKSLRDLEPDAIEGIKTVWRTIARTHEPRACEIGPAYSMSGLARYLSAPWNLDAVRGDKTAPYAHGKERLRRYLKRQGDAMKISSKPA